jgi:hypothetical protein
MRIRALPGLALCLGLVGCAQSEREWLKVDQPYSTAEFRRDHAECTRSRASYDACMKSRGWVSVNPSRPEKVDAPGARSATPRY